MTFTCPYVNRPLPRECEVESCNFNLDNTPISQVFNRCFLFYVTSLSYNPFTEPKEREAKSPEINYSKLPKRYREQIVANFMGGDVSELQRANTDFYTSLLSLVAQDIIFSIKRIQLDPIPFKQCIVCGNSSDSLWYPESGTLPNGWGYCQYSCYQLKPPPIILFEKIMEIDYVDLAKNMTFETIKSRPRAVTNLVRWVFNNTSMK